MKERAPQRKRLTTRQKKLVRAVVMKPHATLKELAQSSNYHDAPAVSKALKAPAVVDELAKMRGLMDQREKLSLGALLTKLEEGLEATQVRSLKVTGTTFSADVETPDQSVRHRWWESAMELRGLKKKDEPSTANGPINIAIILAGGGSEAEKTAVADALLAARLARGLHPIENRDLTPEEAEEYRRTP